MWLEATAVPATVNRAKCHNHWDNREGTFLDAVSQETDLNGYYYSSGFLEQIGCIDIQSVT